MTRSSPHKDRQALLIAHYERLTCDMRQSRKLPDLYKIEEIVCRKQVQVVRISAKVQEWEQAAQEKYGKQCLFQQYKSVIEDSVRLQLLPKLAEHYGSAIRYWHFFEPHEKEGEIKAFTVKGFQEPIFKMRGDVAAREEERLGKIVSRKIRDAYGRGPNRLALTQLSEKCLVLEMEGLLGSFSAQYLERHEALGNALPDLFSALAHHVLQELCEEEWQQELQSFTAVDYKENRIVTLAVRQDAVTRCG
ncbi:hypothetical protein [Azotosporobacter soli]|uniref:hypothetical protein n=1 Tax=Azotosporobacter soli TaxID=3055040 RepID=UPI0031FF1A49